MNANPEHAVSVEKVGDVLVATVDNPPVNALSHAVRAGLVAAVDRLDADPDAAALVILCAGRTFIAGADIRELDGPLREPRLGVVIDRLDRCTRPVVAALHGNALGGGLEVALACSYRIALEGCMLGLPEVRLGLLPGAGGIVRLPRLVGVAEALRMISGGSPVGAAEAHAKGLVDEVVATDLRAAAIACARRLAAGGPVRRTSDLPVPPFDAGLLPAARAELARRQRGLVAPQLAVDLIEMMTVTPFAEAAAKEAATCRELLASPQSRALRHLFVAEREARRIDGVPDGTGPRGIAKVAVIGPGVMGRGIAICFLDAGLPVVLAGRSGTSLEAAVTAIRKAYAGSVRRGALTQPQVEARLDLLEPLDLGRGTDGLGDVDLAVETVSENMALKRQVLAQVSAALKPDAILATNTSFLDIEALAGSVTRPENFVGMHFFNPANVMKLLENVRTSRTAPQVLATAAAVGRRLGKVTVTVGRSEGFVANRMLAKRSREAQFLLEEGATPQQVDGVLTGFGFPIGPFALADLAGMDVMAAARAARLSGMTVREQACNLVDRLVATGRLGQKSGAGYYRYGEDRKPLPDPEVEVLLAAHRAARGFAARAIGDEEILERCLLAMVNEGARILEEGGAARPGDIDVIWTRGLAWPAHLGGPMYWADRLGLDAVRQSLLRYAALVGDAYFRPAGLIERLAAEGRGFHEARPGADRGGVDGHPRERRMANGSQ